MYFRIMDFRFITFVVCVACLFHFTPASAKPTEIQARNGDLAEKFVEFLNQDQQFADLMAEVEAHPDSLSRARRQTMNDMDTEFPQNEPPKKPDGFFDRAAKFMMEVLQRFLKWVNTEQN